MDDKQGDGQDDDQTSNSTAKPDVDDDTLDNAQNIGLYQEAGDEHPSELNIAKEVDKAEVNHVRNEND